MTKNEQIRELALAICHGRVGGDTEICKKCWRNSSRCYYKKLALALYKAGYRKVERGEWELNIDGSHWCSECGHNATYTYDGTEVCGVSCPFCGADMRGEEK